MTLRAKILALSFTIGAIAFVLAGLSAGTIYLIARDRDRLILVRAVDQNIRDTETLATEILLDGGERPYRQWKSLSAELSTRIQGLDALPGVSAGVVNELLSRLEAMDRAFTRIATIGAVDDPLARSILAGQIRTNKGALIGRVAVLENGVHARQSETFRIVIAANVFVLTVLILLGIGHQMVLRRFASRALDELVGAIQQIEDGHLSQPIQSERRDEIGRILLALDQMRAQLNQRVITEDTARQRAEELNQAKSKFVASVSHELRTPLMGLLGMMDLALRRDDPDAIKRDLKRAQTAGGHLLDLVNQILDFSKIEAGKMVITEEPFSPDTLVETARSVFAVQASEKGIQFDLMGPKTPSPLLIGDSQRLSQVLYNLVGNAVKFTDIGAVSVLYQIEKLANGRYQFRVDVIDTGPGIPEDKLNTIFEEFAQVGERGVAGKVGTGLGLTISTRLVSLMGGEIGVRPNREKGAHFFFSVDLDLAPATEDARPEIQDAPFLPTRKCRVLITEDIDINRTIVCEYLLSDGHSVAEAANGVECLEQLRKGPFDIVFMDVNMPVMGGLEATTAIRASSESWSNVPIVGLTANAFEEQVSSYIAAGMNDCISKPVVLAELRAAIARAIKTDESADDIGPQLETQADSRLNAVPLVDAVKFAELRKLVGPEKLSQLIDQSRPFLSHEIGEVENAVDDEQAVKTALHKIKGTAANLTYLRLSALAAGNPASQGEERDLKQLTAELHALAKRSEARALELLHEMDA